MRVSVVGARISGLSAAFELCNGGAEVVVYEKEVYLSGHLRTVAIDGIDLDLGFMVFNRVRTLSLALLDSFLFGSLGQNRVLRSNCNVYL